MTHIKGALATALPSTQMNGIVFSETVRPRLERPVLQPLLHNDDLQALLND
jgi:hypothetical protein